MTTEQCACFPTDPATWTTHGSAVEPGSMYEPNPECPAHGETIAPDSGMDPFEAADDISRRWE